MVETKLHRNKKKIKDLKQPEPTDQESAFLYHELFFSITDQKSFIEYGNEIFRRISKYSESDLAGQLHKVIRHPDMPRSIFNIFWTFLKNNRPVAAYVKNLAKDGSYYWVMTLALPWANSYQSIRLKPGSEVFETAKKLYAETLQYEKKMEQQMDKQSAMEAAEVFALDALNKLGFESYEAFMVYALQAEMCHREDVLKSEHRTLEVYDTSITPNSLLPIANNLTKVCHSLHNLSTVEQALDKHAEYILNLAQSILLLSLNAQIGSTKLDKSDISLSVVAEKMGEQSQKGELQLQIMRENIKELNTLASKLNFDIIVAKLQVEMILMFYKEIDDGISSEAFMYREEHAIVQLIDALKPRIKQILEEIGALPECLSEIVYGVQNIEKFLMVLRFIHTTGKVEISRMKSNFESFGTTFDELIREVESTEVHLKQLSDVVYNNKDIAILYTNISERLTQLNEHLIHA